MALRLRRRHSHVPELGNLGGTPAGATAPDLAQPLDPWGKDPNAAPRGYIFARQAMNFWLGLGANAKFLTGNLSCTLMEVEGKAAEIDLPPVVELKVLEAPPGIRGDTATNVTKPAKVENGFEVGVPIFINPGDSIRVDTRTGKYVSRA